MGGKPRKKPTRTPEEYREIIGELGTCVLWALKFLDAKGLRITTINFKREGRGRAAMEPGGVKELTIKVRYRDDS